MTDLHILLSNELLGNMLTVHGQMTNQLEADEYVTILDVEYDEEQGHTEISIEKHSMVSN